MSTQAREKHKEAWEQVIKSAETDDVKKYGIYTSRSLAVCNPEVYLLGDRWFLEGALKIKGFQKSYESPTALAWCHMDYGGKFFRQGEDYDGIEDGEPLAYSEIDLSKYRVTDPDRIEPDPRLSILDQRIAPLAVSLKVEGKVVSPVELAEMYYFQKKLEDGHNSGELFIVYCDNENSYLWEDGRLFSPRKQTYVSEPSEKPVLIFDESDVWYPLMGRDDTNQAATLDRAVSDLTEESTSLEPESEWEKSQLPRLREFTSLSDERQKDMAALASVRANGWMFHPYSKPWSSFVQREDFDIDISRRLCIIREFNRVANLISPVTAYFYGIAEEGDTLEDKMRELSSSYLNQTGMVRDKEARGWKKPWRVESWGHLWPCGLMEHTISDAFRSRTGHCVSQSLITGAILELMDIPHVVVNFDRGGVGDDVNHHIVFSEDGKFLIDDGIVNFKDLDPETEDYGPLLSFSYQGEWAHTVGDKLYANIDGSRIKEIIDIIERSLAGRFELRFFADQAQDSVVGKTAIFDLLDEEEVEQVTV